MAPDLVGLADLLAARGGRLGRPLTMVATTSSTNDDAKAGAKTGAPHGALWVAEEQTRGRGRQGREWRSPRGENLLFSVILRLGCPPARLPLLSLVAGLAVRDAIAKSLAATGRTANVGVKWPNDVVIQNPGEGGWRKVAGILVESSLTGARVEHAVIGVGINVHTRDFPPELAAIATSLAAVPAPAGDAIHSLDRGAILTDVLENLDQTAEHVAHRGLGIVHGRLVQHDVLAGIPLASDDGALEGTGAGIDLEGRLLVRENATNALRAITSGEIRVKPRYS